MPKLYGKMRCILFILTGLVLTLEANGSVNYCGSKMCSHTNAHTFCRYPAGPSPACTGLMEARLSSEEKTRIIVRLNRRRSDAAQGLRKLPPAGDMLKLRWVEELAREAQRWANQCRPPSSPEEHDICRDLYSITVGQCIASVVGEAPGLRPETMVDIWYMQSKHYRGNVTSYIASEEDNNYYDDFAQMIWSRTYMVGCGRSRFMTHVRGRIRSIERLVCNFAPRGPALYRPLWSPADPATVCPPRARQAVELPALCNFQNDIEELRDENNVMSLEDNLLLDTLLNIERNKSLDYIGSLDEIYLTKLAILTMESLDTPIPSNHSVEKRDDHINNLENHKSTAVNIEFNSNTPNMKIIKKKANFVGRPKTYKVEDLYDLNNEVSENKIPDATARDKDMYGYLEYNEMEDTTLTTINTKNISEYSIKEITHTTDEAIELTSIDVKNTAVTLRVDALDSSIRDAPTSQISFTSNESSIEDKVLDDYLTDPETARQLQEALERVERDLAASSSTPGKVRRELRNLHQNKDNYKTKNDLSAEAERNKSIDRGPMLSMVLKYMPYLKTYEKSILGDSSTSRATNISSFLKFYFIPSLLLPIIL